jgi:hypothetical protein
MSLALLQRSVPSDAAVHELPLEALRSTPRHRARVEDDTRIPHAAARLTSSGRRRQLKVAATWLWARDIITAWKNIAAQPLRSPVSLRAQFDPCS